MREQDKILLEQLKTKNLRYLSAGWTRIYPFTKCFETPTTITKEVKNNEAHFLMEFGDQLDFKLLIKCNCLDYKQSTVYRFSFEEITYDLIENNSKGVSIGIGDLFIETIKLYEPNNPIFKIENGIEKDDLILNGYLSNAIIFEFKNGKSLCLYGSEGDDQHKPTIISNFIDIDEKEIHEIENMRNWELEFEI